mmetsp:Transcript_89558/g.158995  ORF Transcript_89558/g.158995 Transcript_89558/m.158995 type:complete len:242 (-) Transcript_89558:597-1322(-)
MFHVLFDCGELVDVVQLNVARRGMISLVNFLALFVDFLEDKDLQFAFHDSVAVLGWIALSEQNLLCRLLRELAIHGYFFGDARRGLLHGCEELRLHEHVVGCVSHVVLVHDGLQDLVIDVFWHYQELNFFCDALNSSSTRLVVFESELPEDLTRAQLGNFLTKNGGLVEGAVLFDTSVDTCACILRLYFSDILDVRSKLRFGHALSSLFNLLWWWWSSKHSHSIDFKFRCFPTCSFGLCSL